jgi:hypothetical protein
MGGKAEKCTGWSDTASPMLTFGPAIKVVLPDRSHAENQIEEKISYYSI